MGLAQIIKIASILLPFCFLMPQAQKQDEQVYRTKATVKSVYDGDTITVEIKHSIRVRMLDCWAAEVKGGTPEEKAKGIAARDFLRNQIPDGSEIILEIPFEENLSNSLTLNRVLGRIYKNGENLSQVMVNNGHATATKEGN